MTRQLISIPAGKMHILAGREAPNFPTYIDSYSGEPHRCLNSYLRYRYLDRKRSLVTVGKNALHISAFLNHLYLQTNCDDEFWIDAWRLVTTSKVQNFQNTLRQSIESISTRNQYISDIYDFYWFCEQRGYIEGVIGISDIAISDKEYPLYVLPAPQGTSAEFKIPIRERESKRQRANIGTPADWDEALRITLSNESILSERDELILRMVRETNVRREEVVNLHISQFSADLRGEYMTFSLLKDKNNKRRSIKVNAELYRDVQDFIDCARNEFVSGENDAGYIFTGQHRSGTGLHPNYVNQLLNKYGVKPHDGRSVSITERMLQLIDDGMDKTSIMMIVGQEAGHSLSSKGKTLEQHYVQAEVLAKGSKYETVGQLKKKLIEKDQEIEILKKRIEALESQQPLQ